MRRRGETLRVLALAGLLLGAFVGCGDDPQDERGALDPDGGPFVEGGDAGGGGTAGTNAPTGAGGMGGTAGTGGGFSGFGGAGGEDLELADAPVELLVADPNRSAWNQIITVDQEDATTYVSLGEQCYATPDACLASGCGVLASCCVDNGTCCKALDDPPLPSQIDFQSCSGLDVDACVAGQFGTQVDAFGPNAPAITTRGLVPNGTSSAEGGAVIGTTTDLATAQVRIDVEFALPIGCGSTCLESAGVTFSSAPPGSFVEADLGLLLSGSRSEVNLLVGNTVVASFGAGATGTRWTLIASPEGRVEVLRDDVLQAVEPFNPTVLREAALILFGRNLNPDAESTAIANIESETSFCDIPSSWETRDAVTVLDDNSVPLPAERFGHAPSVATAGPEIRFAYEVDDEVFWGTVVNTALVQLLSALPALMASQPHEAGGIRDPELVYDGSTWHLFYTALNSAGVGSIGHAVSNDGFAFDADANPILQPTGDEASLDAPTVHQRDGLWVLVTRATLDNGATELRAHYTPELAQGWSRIEGGQLEGLTQAQGPGDEITDPSLIVHNSGYQLYYALRSGTRWSVQALGSDELLLWRPLGESLGPAVDDSAFDRLGGRAPDALSLPDRIDLVYEGQNGVTFELGWAARPAPWDTAPAF